MKTAIPVALVVLLAFGAMQYFRGSVAPTPEVFGDLVSLDDGIRESAASGKPVVALVTADWCPPCQALKRGTLTDPAVTSWMIENTVRVYINSDENPEDAAKLGVKSLPTTVVLKEGKIVDSKKGNAGAADYLAFLKAAAE